LELNDSCELISINGSKPGEYTIKYLRLNRTQLIKLRTVRRFIKLWKQELSQMLISVEEQIRSIEKQLNEFNLLYSDSDEDHTPKENIFIEMAKIQFDLLLLQTTHSKDLVQHELCNLEYIEGKRLGSDSSD